MSAPRGIINLNLLNIKERRADPARWWDGSVAQDTKHGDGLDTIFENELFGFRAATILIAAYQLDHGCDTIQRIIARWAPSDDTIGSIPGAPPNDPSAYADFIAEQTGLVVSRPTIFFKSDRSIANAWQLQMVFIAMAQMEQYRGFVFPVEFIQSGIALYAHDLAA